MDATLLHFGTLKPFDADALAEAVAVSGTLVTIEEHSIVGGLGSAAAEALAEAGVPVRLRRVGLRDEFAHAVGSREHLLLHYGLTTADITAAALECLATSIAPARRYAGQSGPISVQQLAAYCEPKLRALPGAAEPAAPASPRRTARR